MPHLFKYNIHLQFFIYLFTFSLLIKEPFPTKKNECLLENGNSYIFQTLSICTKYKYEADQL